MVVMKNCTEGPRIGGNKIFVSIPTSYHQGYAAFIVLQVNACTMFDKKFHVLL